MQQLRAKMFLLEIVNVEQSVVQALPVGHVRTVFEDVVGSVKVPLATHQIGGKWWIVEGADAYQRRVFKLVHESEETWTAREIVDDQVELEIVGIVFQGFQTFGRQNA
jgi:hypothetical protein